MKKRLVLMALISALVLCLAVVPVAAAKTTVTFWHAMSKTHSPYLENITKKFNASHPDIEVVLIYQGSYGDLSKKILGAVGAGKPPVMAQVYENWTTKLINAGAIEPAQKYIGSIFTKEDISDIVPGFVDSNTWNKTLYTLPFNKSIYVLFVNQELVPKVPTNWDELLAAAKAATKDTNKDGTPDVYGFGIRPTIDTFSMFLYQAGGQYLTADEKKAVFNNEAGQKALQFLYDMVYKHKCARLDTGYFDGPFGEGKVAMYQDTSAGIPYTTKSAGDKFKWTVAPLVRGVKAAAPFAGTNVAVFSKASDAEKKAAFEYIKYLINTDNTTYWAVNSGYLPVRLSAQKTQAWKSFTLLDTKNMAAYKQLKNGVYEPAPEGWTEIRTVVDNYIKEALMNKMTIKAALDKAVQEVNEILAKN